MRLIFTESAWDDYQWFQSRNRQLLKRVNALIRDVLRSPFDGIGKPERLKADLSGYWSRRIKDEHRLICAVKGGDLLIIACRYHYGE
jgi:toxin YoeB